MGGLINVHASYAKTLGRFFLSVLVILLTGCKPEKPVSSNPLLPTGYKSYVDKDPFHLFVSDRFPSDQSMILRSDLGRTVFDLSVNPETQTKRASTSIGADISANIELTQDDKPEQLSIILSMPGQPSQILRDLNLDGVWDVKYILKTNESFILLNARWVHVDKVDGQWPDIKAQSAQGFYRFDMGKGEWVSNGQ